MSRKGLETAAKVVIEAHARKPGHPNTDSSFKPEQIPGDGNAHLDQDDAGSGLCANCQAKLSPKPPKAK